MGFGAEENTFRCLCSNGSEVLLQLILVDGGVIPPIDVKVGAYLEATPEVRRLLGLL